MNVVFPCPGAPAIRIPSALVLILFANFSERLYSSSVNFDRAYRGDFPTVAEWRSSDDDSVVSYLCYRTSGRSISRKPSSLAVDSSMISLEYVFISSAVRSSSRIVSNVQAPGFPRFLIGCTFSLRWTLIVVSSKNCSICIFFLEQVVR